MKTGILFTGSGPILFSTKYDSFTAPEFVARLREKGIGKFIAFEVSLDLVKELYGAHFDAEMKDQHQLDDLRVVDAAGHHVFNNFSFAQFGEPIYYEAEAVGAG